MPDNSAESQRQRILHHLRAHGSLTTLEARHRLDILHPAQRCLELKKEGHLITTHWCNDITPEGHSHRVARYILEPKKQLSIFEIFTEGK